MFCLTIPALTLWVAMLAYITCSEAADYSSICLDPADYNGSAVYAGTTTCDASLTSSSGCVGCAGQVFENVSWPNPTCSNFTATGPAMNLLTTAATICCGGKKSVCVKDYSRMCKDPSKYVGTNIASGSVSCDNALAFFTDIPSGHFYGINWSTDTCSAFTGNARTNLDAYARLCCSDEKSLCAQDYSKVCKNPANYNGSAVYSAPYTCDGAMALFTAPSPTINGQNIWENVSWPNATCEEFPDASNYRAYLDMIGDKCCSDKQDVCAQDYSKVCKNPANYNGIAVYSGTTTCDAAMKSLTSSNNIWESVSWPNATCAEFADASTSSQPSTLMAIGDKCCSDKQDVCAPAPDAYKAICQTPSDYSPSAHLTGSSNSCGDTIRLYSGPNLPFAKVNWATATCATLKMTPLTGQVSGQFANVEQYFHSGYWDNCCSNKPLCRASTKVPSPSEGSEDANTSGSMGNRKGSVPMMLSVVLFSSLLTVRS